MAAPTFTVACLWECNARVEQVSSVILSLAELVEAGKVSLSGALRSNGVALQLVMDFSLYQRALLGKLAAKVEWSDGRFIELLRIREDQREKFREQFLKPSNGEPQAFPNFGEAARAIREHLARLKPSSPPPAATPTGPAATPSRAPRAPLPRSVASAPEAVKAVPAPVLNARSATRFEVQVEVEFKTDEEFVREYATNISKGGMFVRTSRRPALNSEVEMVVKLPSGQTVDLVARVVHVLDSPEHGGLGLAFTPNSAKDARLGEYLATLLGK
jgi:uncharacterized protein (TIGR02266 family)